MVDAHHCWVCGVVVVAGSLLDIFKAHIVNGTKMKKKDQIIYATVCEEVLLNGKSYFCQLLSR